MRLGIGTYAYMWSIGFPGAQPARPMRALDLIGRARELGLTVVQFGPNLALYDLPANELQTVLEAVRDARIELEVGTRGLEPGHLLRMLDFTRACGSVLLRTVNELEGGKAPTQSELAAILKDVEPQFRSAGVRLAIENSLIPAAIVRAALEETASPWIGVTLDTVNSLAIPEGTREAAETLAPWTYCLHVKDFVVRREWHMMGFRVEGRPAGQGQLDIPWLLGVLRRHGARCNAILELWPPPQDTLEQTVALEQRWAAESIEYLKGLIPEPAA